PPTTARVYGLNWPKGADAKYTPDGHYAPDDNYGNACLIFQLWFERNKIDYIGKELLRRGIPSARGKTTWASSSIITILKNPIYAGRVATLKYERVEPKERRKNKSGKTSARLKSESEWHYLDGLVDKPIITWEQRLSIIERLKMNKDYADRNAKHNFLLKGLISCQLCHNNRHYYGVEHHGHPKYVCNKHYAVSYGDRCPAKPMDMAELDAGVKEKVRSFLTKPEVYLMQMEGKLALPEQTKADMEHRITDLERQYRDTIDAECRYADMLSQEAFDEKKKLLMTKRQYLNGEKDQQTAKLAALALATINRLTVEALRKRLQRNLDTATEADWRFILESLGVNVLAFGDGSWDIEICVPSADSRIVENHLIANQTPWCTYPC
ncbi:MAG: recombinase family protein, partial [Dehalococcoidales bacterium]|nr:recombinase family protein [Dehalococcoidales bacterium]